MKQSSPLGNVQVHIDGELSGQLAIGNYNLQIGEIHGGIVNIMMPAEKPNFSRLPRPVYVRPHAFAGLLNRTEELSIAVGALRVSESVSIHGQHGLGKTVVLRYLAYNSPGDNFPDGILYLPARRPNIEDILQEIFDHFYESDRPAKPSAAQLRQLLQSLSALILMDDVALEYDQVAELINNVPQCAFVFASTERCLWGEGRCIPLDGLPVPEALTLIERELGRPLVGEERSVAEAFCQKIKGHPLHAIQSAALVRQGKTFTEIGDTFCESEDAVTRSVFTQLSDSQKQVLLWLAASGNFPISMDHFVGLSQGKEPGAQLKPLLDLRLIQANSPAYNLTGSLALSLRRMTDLTESENQVLDYFVRWIRQNPPLRDVMDVLNPLLFLLERAMGKGRWQEVISLGRGIEKALIVGKRWQAWSRVLDWVLKAAMALGDRATQGWALHELGTRHLCLGDLEPARRSLTQALEIRQTLGDQAGAAATQHNLGLILAPPAPPQATPRSKPGPASTPGGSPILKIILGLAAIAVVVIAALVIWYILTGVQPPPAIVPPPAVFTSTSTYTTVPSDAPGSTNVPSPTFTPTATETRTPTRTITPSQTPSNTPIPTATGSVSFTSVSTDLVYYGGTSCGSQNVTITVRVSVPNGIKDIELYYRFDYSGAPKEPKALTMKPAGGDLYQRTLNPTDLLGGSVPFQRAQLIYQVVVQQNDGDYSVRTPPMSDITVEACADPTATIPPDLTPPPAPQVIGPSNGQVLGCPRSTVSGDEVFLRWTEPPDQSGIANYSIELRYSLDAINWNGDNITKGSVTQFEISDYIATRFDQCNSEGRIYFKWRIQAWDGAFNLGEWSPWAEFNVLNIT